MYRNASWLEYTSFRYIIYSTSKGVKYGKIVKNKKETANLRAKPCCLIIDTLCAAASTGVCLFYFPLLGTIILWRVKTEENTTHHTHDVKKGQDTL